MIRRLLIRGATAILLVALLLGLAGCGGRATTQPDGNASVTPPAGRLTVDFIDVGQADSILVRCGDAAMLIDAGNNADADAVVAYLQRAGVEKLDIVVGTHPHEDHIGGLDAVIKAFPVGQVVMPKVTTTTKTFEDVLLAIKDKGLKISAPTPDSGFDLGEAHGVFLAPRGAKFDDLNDYSVVIRLTYGKTSFLFTGDAGRESESAMAAAGLELRSDVLKVGHHGSSTSSTAAFLDQVKPRYAVISVGKDNDYGHPHRATLDRLSKQGITVYRTDVIGTIVATSDGQTVSFTFEKGK